MKRTGRKLALATLAVLALIGSGSTAIVTADTPPQGINSLASAPPNIQQGNRPTLYERYPAFAYVVPVSITAGGPSLGPVKLPDPTATPADLFYTGVASVELGVLVAISTVTISMLESAYQVDVIKMSGALSGNVITALQKGLYAPLLEIVLAISALWVGWQFLHRRFLAAGQGMGWIALAAMASGIFFVAPGPMLQAVNGFANDVSLSMLGIVGSADPAMMTRSSNPELAKGDASVAELRASADRLWYTMVFLPYGVATFGDVDAAAKYAPDFLAKNAHQSNNFSNLWSGAPQYVQNWFDGDSAVQRPAIMAGALLAGVLTAALVALLAVTMLLSEAALLIAWMLGPVAFLVGFHPGRGRRVLETWLNICIAALLVRVLSSLLMAITMTATSMASNIHQWAIACAINASLLVVAVILHKQLLSYFRKAANPRRLWDESDLKGLLERSSGMLSSLRGTPAPASATTDPATASAGFGTQTVQPPPSAPAREGGGAAGAVATAASGAAVDAGVAAASAATGGTVGAVLKVVQAARVANSSDHASKGGAA